MPLTITVKGQEFFNNETDEFIYAPDTKLVLEHSLISVSKWESKWHKHYLNNKSLTSEELLDYIKCMCIKEVPDKVFDSLTQENINDIVNYINDPMTATTFADDTTKSTSREIVTSEVIYYWMIALQIPVEFQKWHINRLLTLINVCRLKNDPKKMSKSDIMRRNAALNAQRRAKLGSKG